MDAVTSVSKDAADNLIGRGVSAQQVRVVPNGIDISRFCPRERLERVRFLAEQFPKDDPEGSYFLIGSAGNLRTLKGYGDLIEAMPRITAMVPNARCLIWGNGPDREGLILKAEQLGVDHTIRFCGFEKYLEEKLPLLDLYVQPSRIESFGMAAAEAMACGVPVLVSEAGGLKNLIQDGVSGQLFAAGNTAALADQVIGMVRDQEQRTRLGAAGRVRIEEHFSQEQMAETMRQLYDKLVEERQSN